MGPPVTSRQRSAHRGSVLLLQIEHAIWSVLNSTKINIFLEFFKHFFYELYISKIDFMQKIIFHFCMTAPL